MLIVIESGDTSAGSQPIDDSSSEMTAAVSLSAKEDKTSR